MIKRMFSAIQAHDLDALLLVCDPDIAIRSLIAEAEGGTFRGHDGVRSWWAAVIEMLDVRPGAESFEEFRGRGITRMALAGRIGDVQVPQTMWMAWKVRNGKVVWWRTCRTEADALEAAGLSE